jgi:hypothetical protein
MMARFEGVADLGLRFLPIPILEIRFASWPLDCRASSWTTIWTLLTQPNGKELARQSSTQFV